MLRSLGCQCCEQEPGNEAKIISEKTEYGPIDGGAPLEHKSFSAAVPEDQAPAEEPEKMQEQSPDATTAVASNAAQLSPSGLTAEVEREKQRLQELVKAFVKRAVKGIDCKYVDQATGELCPGKYYVDKRLRELSIKVPETGPPFTVDDIYSIGAVTDVLQKEAAAARISSTALPNEVVLRLLTVVEGDRTLCIAESSPEDADNFFVCMGVLREYCCQQGQRW
jgi:hypothetical protein